MENGNAPISATPYMDMTNSSGELWCDNTGLTKREHFAGLALQGLLSKNLQGLSQQKKAMLAVEYADALLKELEK